MYQLLIFRANGTKEQHTFTSFTERDNYIMDNWDDMADWLVPCSWGGWIDIRDCY